MPVEPELPEINGRAYQGNVVASYPDGEPRTKFNAASDLSDLRLVVKFRHKTSQKVELPVEIVEYYEEGFEYRRRQTALYFEPDDIGIK